MHDTEAPETTMNSIIIISEAPLLEKTEDPEVSVDLDIKSTKSKKSTSSKKSRKNRRSSNASSSSKKSKSKKDKSKAKRCQSTSTSKPLEQEQPMEQQQSRPKPVAPRKVNKKVSFADSDSANHVVEADKTMTETESLWWTRTELEMMRENVQELCKALQHEEEYIQALQTLYSETGEESVTPEQQQAIRILIKYNDAGRGLEQHITQEASHKRLASTGIPPLKPSTEFETVQKANHPTIKVPVAALFPLSPVHFHAQVGTWLLP